MKFFKPKTNKQFNNRPLKSLAQLSAIFEQASLPQEPLS
jgi:hypothetical protein